MKKTEHRSLPLVLTGWFLTMLMVITPLLAPIAANAQQAQLRQDTVRPEGNEDLDAPDQAADPDQEGLNREGDNFKSPKAAERYARRQAALKQRIAGSR